MTLMVPVSMVPSHQPTWQDFLGVSKSIFSQVPHWLPGHVGEGEENMCLHWNQKQHSRLFVFGVL